MKCFSHFVLVTVIECVYSLQINNIDVPAVVDIRETVTLSCTFSMGKDKLHSVKFYKDDREFYRFTPHQAAQHFSLPGIQIVENSEDVCSRRFCSISLTNLNSRSSGIYKCEISGDAPTFNVVFESRNMTVAVLPQHAPYIKIRDHQYDFGDLIYANCTSDVSYPPAYLTWYINDKQVSYHHLRHDQTYALSRQMRWLLTVNCLKSLKNHNKNIYSCRLSSFSFVYSFATTTATLNRHYHCQIDCIGFHFIFLAYFT